MTSIDHLDTIPAEVSEHARAVVTVWLGHARAAWLKGDLLESERLHRLVRDKINSEMALTRLCQE